MRNHYAISTKVKEKEPFASAGESLLFTMFQPQELITIEALVSRLNIYCQSKRDETKGIRADTKTVEGHLKLLTSKGYVKEIPGDALDRVVNYF